MPMWFTWINPRTQKQEHIYNYYDVDDPACGEAIRTSKRALSNKFGIPVGDIPGFRVESAPWVRNPVLREVAWDLV